MWIINPMVGHDNRLFVHKKGSQYIMALCMYIVCLIMVFSFTDMPEVTQSPMPSASEHEGKLNYSVHVHTPLAGSSEPLFGENVPQAGPRKRQSTPLKASTSKPEKVLLTLKPEKVLPATAATPRAATSTLTVSRPPKADNSSDVSKPIPLAQFYGKSLSNNVSRPLEDSQAASCRPPTSTTSEKKGGGRKITKTEYCHPVAATQDWVHQN